MFKTLRQLFNRSHPYHSLSDPNAIIHLGGRTSSIDGISVNSQTVMGLPAVWAGTNYTARFVAKLNCEVFKRIDETGRKTDKRHPAYKIIRRRANDHTSSRNWIADMTAAAVLHGNSYSIINRDENGIPESVTMLDSNLTRPDLSLGFLVYKTQLFDGKTYKELTVLPENIIHLRGLGCNGSLSGISVIDIMREQLSGSLALQRTTTELFNKGAFVQGSIEYADFLIKDPQQFKEKKQEIQEQYLGLRNSQGVMILQGAKFNPWNINAEAMQFLQSKEFDLRLVSLIFLLPPHILASQINSSYGAIEQENLATLDRLDYWLLQWEDELSEKLLTEKEKESDSRFIEFNREMAIRMDTTAKINALITQRNNGGINTDQMNAKLNEPPLPDGLGQLYYIPSNLVELGKEPVEPESVPQFDPTALQAMSDAGSQAVHSGDTTPQASDL